LPSITAHCRKFNCAFLLEKRFVYITGENESGVYPEIDLALKIGDSPEIDSKLAREFLEHYLDRSPGKLAELIRTADETGAQPLMDEALERLQKGWTEYLRRVDNTRMRIEELSIHNVPERIPHVVSFFRQQVETVIATVAKDFIIQELREKMVEDELTRLLNRKGYEQHIGSKIALSKRESRPLSLLIIDIDYFKNINDKHGHHAGDQILVELAKRMVQATRSEDLVCRWGGEEFVIVLDNANAGKGIAAAGRIMDYITREDFKVTGQDGMENSVKVTISVGGRDFKGDREKMEKGADHDLYVSKGGGKGVMIVDQNGAKGGRNSLTFNNRLIAAKEILDIRAKYSTRPPAGPRK
jgi:diguanylate cyclase (GGDEF)-like protein